MFVFVAFTVSDHKILHIKDPSLISLRPITLPLWFDIKRIIWSSLFVSIKLIPQIFLSSIGLLLATSVFYSPLSTIMLTLWSSVYEIGILTLFVSVVMYVYWISISMAYVIILHPLDFTKLDKNKNVDYVVLGITYGLPLKTYSVVDQSDVLNHPLWYQITQTQRNNIDQMLNNIITNDFKPPVISVFQNSLISVNQIIRNLALQDLVRIMSTIRSRRQSLYQQSNWQHISFCLCEKIDSLTLQVSLNISIYYLNCIFMI